MNTISKQYMMQMGLKAIKIVAFTFLLIQIPVFSQKHLEDKNSTYMSSAIDYGHLIKGVQEGQDKKGMPLNRNTVKLGVIRAINSQWELEAGFKSVLWWPFGGTGNQTHERIVRVEATLEALNISRAFEFGSSTTGKVKAGYFPYKYNGDAKNLGEYLHRSGTYPGFLNTSEKWELMNGATPYFYGFHFQLNQFDGILQHDFTLFMETISNPVGDFTPGYELKLNFGLVEIAGGLAYNHLISFRPSKLTPKNDRSGYVSFDTTVVMDVNGIDTFEVVPAYTGFISDAPRSRAMRDGLYNPPIKYLTHRGIKLMGRGAFNFGSIFSEEIVNPEDGKIFFEIGVLGLENQPYQYEKLSERIPIMFGVNIPTFKYLDVLTFQMQYYGSPYNNFTNYNDFSTPTWKEVKDFSTGELIPNSRDNWKWSAYSRRSINKIFRIHLQIANDHIRTVKFDGIQSNIELTQNPSHWYYLVKFEFGI